jgi:tetratricopeptide (TPR) repeat protein
VRRILPPLLLLFAAAPLVAAPARDKAEDWVEVRSQHFVVATNSGEKQGRRVADQFERMRSMFHTEFPKMQVDPATPIVVLAIKDEKDFRALEPEAYLAKGQLKLGGLFLRAPDKNYVLMRLDVAEEHPYSVVYHEYTHLLLSKDAEWLPLWLNEGLAEFYENTDIREKEVLQGEPSPGNIQLLRESRLLPLATLFAVDEKSPYYHEENKGSIFYAESWALTHYLEVRDFKEKAHRLGNYMELLTKDVDPVTAAGQAFGDLKQLQSALESYVRQGSFSYFKMGVATEVDQSAFKVQALSPAQTDALRADFLAYNQRFADAHAILDRVLQEDPNNASAYETQGFLEFRQGHLEEAKKSYARAVQLDSQSYLAHYYFAAIAMNGSLAPSDEAQVESSLRTAIKLNPSFAPTFDRLAVFLAMHHRDLEEAHMMGLTAVGLDPANVGYRVNVAHELLTMENGKSAVEVLRAAAKVAKTPAESQSVEETLRYAQEYIAAQEQASRQGMSTIETTVI